LGKSSPSPPPAPNPAATAAAQTASNVNTAIAQTALNDVNQNTPFGTTSFQQTGTRTTPDGSQIPTFTQDTTLNPLSQAFLTGTQGIEAGAIPAAQALAGQSETSLTNPLNFNTPFSDTLNKGPQILDQNTVDAIYGQQKGFLDPQWNQNQQQLQDQLSRQGIGVGSQAYSGAQTQFDNARTQAYQSAQDAAISGGTGAAQNLFNMALQGQQQNVGQQQLAQTNPLANLQALFGAVPATPLQPINTPNTTQVSPTNTIAAQQLQTEQQNANFQAQIAQQNAQFGGLAGLGGSALTAAALFA
jgi:hypothetical protein